MIARVQARQLYARHLYVLMMLVMDRGYLVPAQGVANGRQYTARRVAQWAVNVVDFLDPDSICTPFEFDYEPFVNNDGMPQNGTWDVDGWVGRNAVANQPSRRRRKAGARLGVGLRASAALADGEFSLSRHPHRGPRR